MCQIGYGRTYVQKDYDNIGTIISKVLSSRSHAINACDGNDKEFFKPRIVLNDPKNCSHVDFEVKALIINTVFENLLLKESEIKEKYESTKISSKGVSWKDWKNGGNLLCRSVIGENFHVKFLPQKIIFLFRLYTS